MPSAYPRGTMVTRWTGSAPGTTSPRMACPPSWYATRSQWLCSETGCLRNSGSDCRLSRQHAPQDRNIRARAYPHILRGMGRCAREARIDDDQVCAVDLLAREEVLDRGCASAGLPPMMIMVFELRRSLHELVCAP